jgi:hypothetical protein
VQLLPAATRAQVQALAEAVFANGPPDLGAWRSAAMRMADRFGLLVAGSLAPALDAGPVQGLYRLAPEAMPEALKASARALDLCGFAARDAVWALRRELGLG